MCSGQLKINLMSDKLSENYLDIISKIYLVLFPFWWVINDDYLYYKHKMTSAVFVNFPFSVFFYPWRICKLFYLTNDVNMSHKVIKMVLRTYTKEILSDPDGVPRQNGWLDSNVLGHQFFQHVAYPPKGMVGISDFYYLNF